MGSRSKPQEIDWRAVALILADHLLHYEPEGSLRWAVEKSKQLPQGMAVKMRGRGDPDGFDVEIGR